MSAYAKKNNLALKSLYNARALLMKKGILPSISCDYLVPKHKYNGEKQKDVDWCLYKYRHVSRKCIWAN